MNKETLYELRSLVALYPYYQTARLLMLKNMYLLHDTAFDDELRRAALYVSDRRLLFDLVEGARYKIKTVAEKAAEEAAEAARRKKEVDANRTISIIGNSSWAPNVSGKLMMEKTDALKKCTILGDGVHISSSPADDDTLENLAKLIAGDIMKEKKA